MEEYALASTYRLEEPTKVLPASVANREAYAGPWRALYEMDENGNVRKHAMQGSNAVSLVIPDSQSAVVCDRADGDVVESVYDGLESANVRVDEWKDDELDEDIEQQLEDLGYLR